MKYIISIIAAVAITACSSTKKTTTETPAPAVEQKTMETSSSDMETKTDKVAKKGKKEAATSAEVTSSGTLPAITGTEKSAVTCTNKGDSRKITTLNVTEGGCGVVYNKAGEDKTVAIAKSDMNYCETVSTKIKTNLEGAGFSCGGGDTSSSDAPTKKQ